MLIISELKFSKFYGKNVNLYLIREKIYKLYYKI